MNRSLFVSLILLLAVASAAAYVLHGIRSERPVLASGAPPPTT